MKEKIEEEKNLNEYAKKAKLKIFNNRYLYEKLKYLTDYNKITKTAINNYVSKQNPDKITILKNYKSKLKIDNNNFYNEYEKANNKLNSLLNICIDDTSMEKPILLEAKNYNFRMNFTIEENNNTIKALNNSIIQSKKFGLFREVKRDNLVEKEKADKVMEKYTTYMQDTMLFELKKCNEFNEKIKKYNLKKTQLKNNMNLLNKYISNNKTNKIKGDKIDFNEEQINKINDNKKIKGKINIFKTVRVPKKKKIEKKLDEDDYENNSNDDYELNKIKINHEMIKEFKNIDNLFRASILDIEMDQEIHSEDDTIYDNKFINKKQLSTNYKNSVHKLIPKLNVKLIAYNQKNNREIDMYSLQRRRFERKTLQKQVKEMEKKKEKIKTSLDNLTRKINKLKQLNQTMKDNYKSMKLMVNNNNSISNIKQDFIMNSLNNGKNYFETKEEEEKVDVKEKEVNFLDALEEVEEEEIIDAHDNERSDEKKETKDTKKEDEEEKEINKNYLKGTRKFEHKYKVKTNKSYIPHLKKVNLDLKGLNSK